MKAMLLVALGGAVGSVARYALARGVAARWPEATLPWATSAVNVVGCLALGVLVARVPEGRAELRVLLGTGVLGGFTTMSTFGVETATLLREQPRAAVLHVLVNVGLGIAAAMAGLLLGRR